MAIRREKKPSKKLLISFKVVQKDFSNGEVLL